MLGWKTSVYEILLEKTFYWHATSILRKLWWPQIKTKSASNDFTLIWALSERNKENKVLLEKISLIELKNNFQKEIILKSHRA